MSDTLIAAISSVVAIAILAPLANHFITKYRERRSLRATLWVHECPLPAFLNKHLRDLHWTPAPATKPDVKLFVLCGLSGYMKLALHNPSKKKLNAVTVTLADSLSQPLHQIEDQPELRDERKIPSALLFLRSK